MKLTKHLVTIVLAVCLLVATPLNVGASNAPLVSSDEAIVSFDSTFVQSSMQPRASVFLNTGIAKVSSTTVRLYGAALMQLPKTTFFYIDLYRSSGGTPVYYKTIAMSSFSSSYFEQTEIVTVDPGYTYQCVFSIINTDFPSGAIAQSDTLKM